MKISPTVIARLRFTVGVLLVWGGVTFASNLITGLWTRNFASETSSRLKFHQLCTVFSVRYLATGTLFPPEPCWVMTRECQLSPDRNHGHGGPQYEGGMVDNETLVMVFADSYEATKDRPWEQRWVGVSIISGPDSGRSALISRDKLRQITYFGE